MLILYVLSAFIYVTFMNNVGRIFGTKALHNRYFLNDYQITFVILHGPNIVFYDGVINGLRFLVIKTTKTQMCGYRHSEWLYMIHILKKNR